MIVNSIEAKHRGVYRCIASNALGITVRNINVDIKCESTLQIKKKMRSILPNYIHEILSLVTTLCLILFKISFTVHQLSQPCPDLLLLQFRLSSPRCTQSYVRRWATSSSCSAWLKRTRTRTRSSWRGTRAPLASPSPQTGKAFRITSTTSLMASTVLYVNASWFKCNIAMWTLNSTQWKNTLRMSSFWSQVQSTNPSRSL